ncbi:MAG: hypothetical protein ACRD3V_09410 [Vicinamibacteria bacterium]
MNHNSWLVLLYSLLAGSLACTNPEPPPADPAPAAETEETPEPPPTPAAPEADLAQIKTRLEAAKTELFDQEKYNCCVQPSCDWCALHEGYCDCFANLQAGETVCPGCGLGWHNGQGIVEGIDPDDVKWNITHEHAAGGHQH